MTNIPSEMTPSECAEEAAAFAAVAMFRANERDGPLEAAELGSNLAGHIVALSQDFRRNAMDARIKKAVGPT